MFLDSLSYNDGVWPFGSFAVMWTFGRELEKSEGGGALAIEEETDIMRAYAVTGWLRAL